MDISRTRVLGTITELPLKDMEASLLTRVILEKSRQLGLDVPLISQAIDLAAYAHRAKTRANRGPMPRTHYVEHVLRVALRTIRYGCVDQNVIIAAILHDTVEDHVLELSRDFGYWADDETAARAELLNAYEDTFGPEVAFLVTALTNPLDIDGTSRATKNARYVTHVLEEITEPRVFLIKFSDFADNALSLHHTAAGTGAPMVQRLATKYLPLVLPFTARIGDADILALVGADGVEQMRDHINGNRLQELALAA